MTTGSEPRPYHRTRLGRPQIVRPFGLEEDEAMTAARIAGLGTTAIARQLQERFGRPRSQATVNMRLKALAARDEASA